MSVRTLLAAACTVLLGTAGTAVAQSADNVLLVINDASPESVRVGEYYAQKRSIAKDHIVRLRTSTAEAIDRPDFERTIEAPVGAAISQRRLQDRIFYIVLTKGTPLLIRGTQGQQGVTASVDSELTLLYRRLLGQPVALLGKLTNPYYLGNALLATAKPFTHFSFDIYLVTRLDGFTVDDVIGLIDRGASPARDGKIVLDKRSTLFDPGGDKWLDEAAERLRRGNGADRVVLEDTTATATFSGPVLGYYSWGSNDATNHLRRFGLTFVPGALAAMFVSTDGRSFVEPAAAWIPGEPNGRSVGSGTQSLAGDLIRDGVTGVAAHVTEPYLDATIRPQILFPVYLQGFNLAESFYLAMPYVSWQTIVVGDPLCAPFARTPLQTSQLYKGQDPDTELPALFSDRKVALMASGGLKVEGLKLLLKAQARSEQGDTAAVEPLLVRATEIEPRLTGAQTQLAVFYESSGQYEKAIERYRRGVAAEPKNPLLLNNLAYALAVRVNQADEALPLAEQAYQLSKSPAIADTLGWIRHLRGDDRGALAPLEAAVNAAPLNAELLMHLAIVHEALGDLAKARAAIDTAAKSDPKIEQRDDVKALRKKLAR